MKRIITFIMFFCFFSYALHSTAYAQVSNSPFATDERTIYFAIIIAVLFIFVIISAFLVINNLGLRKNLESALEKATIASKAKSDFLSNMSHEMRTPMNVIIGMASIAMKTKDVEQKNQALSKIEDASSHLLGVINDVLDMSKIEANMLELVPVEYCFDVMLQKVVSMIHFRADEKRQRLTVHIDDHVPSFIIGDDQRLAQVITNLMYNAVKFTPEEGMIHLEASLTGEIDGICKLSIVVADNGIGISPENQEKLFNAFEQADSGLSREYGGTGLGLVISKRIIELMGGSIRVESEQGKGARFIFTVQAQRGSKNLSSLLAPGTNWETVRILVVDGEISTRSQFQNIFDSLNMQCDVASDRMEALRMIEENSEYDIYFLDWCIPDMDGIELTRRIKSQRNGRLPAVIMITDNGALIDSEATQAGVDKRLFRPLFSSVIIDCINECMGITSGNQGEILEHFSGAFVDKRVLIVEDVEINREIFIMLLSDTGLSIDCAEDGKAALDMIKAVSEPYDIVFMDMQMPKMDGLEATRHIRALPGHQREALPIIALTANVFQDDIEACHTAGMDDHLGKPLDIDEIMKILHKYLKPDINKADNSVIASFRSDWGTL